MSGYETANLEELRRDDGWAPIRLALDIRSFGINGWTGRTPGDIVIPAHDEAPTGHEELYLVTAGRATFSIGEEEVDGPAGTIVFVRDPRLRRGAVAREPATTVLTVGATPGAAFVPRAWEADRKIVVMVTHDVDEALYLADRLVLMTDGPEARVGEILSLPFARPRERHAVLEHPEYYGFRRHVIDFLETSSSFASPAALGNLPD